MTTQLADNNSKLGLRTDERGIYQYSFPENQNTQHKILTHFLESGLTPSEVLQSMLEESALDKTEERIYFKGMTEACLETLFYIYGSKITPSSQFEHPNLYFKVKLLQEALNLCDYNLQIDRYLSYQLFGPTDLFGLWLLGVKNKALRPHGAELTFQNYQDGAMIQNNFMCLDNKILKYDINNDGLYPVELNTKENGKSDPALILKAPYILEDYRNFIERETKGYVPPKYKNYNGPVFGGFGSTGAPVFTYTAINVPLNISFVEYLRTNKK